MIALTPEEAELMRLILAQPVVPSSHPSHILLVELMDAMAADPVQLSPRAAKIAAGVIEIVMDDPAFHFLNPTMKGMLREIVPKLK